MTPHTHTSILLVPFSRISFASLAWLKACVQPPLPSNENGKRGFRFTTVSLLVKFATLEFQRSKLKRRRRILKDFFSRAIKGNIFNGLQKVTDGEFVANWDRANSTSRETSCYQAFPNVPGKPEHQSNTGISLPDPRKRKRWVSTQAINYYKSKSFPSWATKQISK